MRFILENPIYTGWRLYDEKRDPTTAGYVSRPDARQGYRRKIARTSEEIIRVEVLDALVSEADFNRVQQIIGLKKQKHWRSYSKAPNRYTYNGFLTCGDCASLLYTHTTKEEFYVCKSRNTREARLRAVRGLVPCSNSYMLRNKLEPKIDMLLGEKLRETDFLSRVADEYNAGIRHSQSFGGAQRATIEMKLNGLDGKRRRIMEAFFDGAIERRERNERVACIDAEISTFRHMLMDSMVPTNELNGAHDLEALLRAVRGMGVPRTRRQASVAGSDLPGDPGRAIRR